MAVTQVYSGTKAVDTTEWSLTTDTGGPDADTNAGVYQAFLDVSDLVAGDILQFRIYEKARSGDTQRIVFEAILKNAQAEPIFVTPALMLMHGWDMTCDALAGTVTVLWSIRKA